MYALKILLTALALSNIHLIIAQCPIPPVIEHTPLELLLTVAKCYLSCVSDGGPYNVSLHD